MPVFCLALTAGVLGQLGAADDPPDPRPPLPPTLPSQGKDYRVPNPDRAIFRGFQDPKTLKR
ncbi:MAG: hypothetical protein WHU94_07795, partial [Thermogemmata sp.]